VIVRAEGDRLRLVTQPDHAHFAAAALALFRLASLAGHPRRGTLLRAVRLHDNGWRELDAAPPCDPRSGLPYDFMELPQPLRLEVWRRGTERYLESDPYVALLAGEHALALHRGREETAGWGDLLGRLAERRERLRARAGLSEKELAADYRWLDLADQLSLAACAGWDGARERHGCTFHLAGTRLLLTPFPLAGASTLRVPCRYLERRHFAGDAALGAALAAAPWRSFDVQLAPQG
jgi:hypothetical protein